MLPADNYNRRRSSSYMIQLTDAAAAAAAILIIMHGSMTEKLIIRTSWRQFLFFFFFCSWYHFFCSAVTEAPLPWLSFFLTICNLTATLSYSSIILVSTREAVKKCKTRALPIKIQGLLIWSIPERCNWFPYQFSLFFPSLFSLSYFFSQTEPRETKKQTEQRWFRARTHGVKKVPRPHKFESK